MMPHRHTHTPSARIVWVHHKCWNRFSFFIHFHFPSLSSSVYVLFAFLMVNSILYSHIMQQSSAICDIEHDFFFLFVSPSIFLDIHQIYDYAKNVYSIHITSASLSLTNFPAVYFFGFSLLLFLSLSLF